jgi:DNA-binding XRE family transcriptional regulator
MLNTEALAEVLAQARTQRRLPKPPVRREIRKRSGLTQDGMARVLGVTRITVLRWEAGQRSPRGKLAARYVDLLDRLRAEALMRPA